jgi:ArsR family transcriptional regulator
MVEVVKALASERRLQILAWLKQPTAHFPPQVDGDLVRDGVCGVFIAQKLGVSQPTASEHLKVLTRAGLLRARRIKQWTFYQRDEKRIAEVKRMFRSAW